MRMTLDIAPKLLQALQEELKQSKNKDIETEGVDLSMDPPPFEESPKDSDVLPDALESAPPAATCHNSPHTMSGSIEAAHCKAFKKKIQERK